MLINHRFLLQQEALLLQYQIYNNLNSFFPKENELCLSKKKKRKKKMSYKETVTGPVSEVTVHNSFFFHGTQSWCCSATGIIQSSFSHGISDAKTG